MSEYIYRNKPMVFFNNPNNVQGNAGVPKASAGKNRKGERKSAENLAQGNKKGSDTTGANEKKSFENMASGQGKGAHAQGTSAVSRNAGERKSLNGMSSFCYTLNFCFFTFSIFTLILYRYVDF